MTTAPRLALLAVALVACARAGSWSTPELDDAGASIAIDAPADAPATMEPCRASSTRLMHIGGAAIVRIAVADDGEIHVVAAPQLGSELVYLRRARSGTWSQETIGPVVQPTSLVVDRGGSLHVATLGLDARTVRVARRAPDGTWTWETAAATTDRFAGLDLALGPDGDRYLVYGQNDLTGRLTIWLGQRGSKGWLAERVPAPPDIAGVLALAIDADGHPHLAYLRVSDSSDGVGYGHEGDEGWRFTTLSEPAAYLDVDSLAIDSAGRPHVVFHLNRRHNGTVHAQLTDAGWRFAWIAFASSAPSIAFGPRGPRLLAKSHLFRQWFVASPAAHETYDLAEVQPEVLSPGGAIAVDRLGGLHTVTVADDGTLVYTQPCDPEAVAAAWRY